ncbi:Peptidoglycan/LPS O-acetylase OafA/YrhL, contains acyltransferase and SGNH-hydrolase domains [Geodermatophilus obscurus]|uniref:Peptidoglycan/LPS O-acetylase OafA/YrhL, contains acyltransferase and SGNH-hydrolase domains n=1 Tax=Geodermatophilus obscurus TaxID=1861 RepID=A0A1I5HFU8_9ACTN|nr:acyltransferase family protein [Geodermatophilus obscurus]SFO47113.1 Peptidoglycan/LPS O-acetylase OafA/YrhL, contains acyltransferase and SGNH-hydrolase domains [Geodermatophilus obscurus]
MSVLTRSTARGVPGAGRSRRRTELDGLRAIAVTLVVAYHVSSGRVSGGVDVFLVLSGFFLVQVVSGHIRREGRVPVLRAVTRSLSRLLPTALLVLLATVVASVWVVPHSRWRELALHLLSSVTFTENARLVDEAVDYSASNAAASPMQQFWSLSIQVQVLVLAPVAVAAGAAVLRWAGWAHFARQAVVGSVALVTAASFAWSVVATATNQQQAYFSSLPRLWELGAGALVALLLRDVRPGPRSAAALGWSGVVALVACGAVLDGAHEFPGWQAGWPVLCAVAVLVAADHGGRLGVHRVLGAAPMRWLGARSYPLYLWHWPVLVLYLVHTQRETPSPRGAAAVVVLSLGLAAVTHRLVERPAGDRLRARPPVGALALVVVAALPLAATGGLVLTWLDREAARVATAADDPAYPGAAALGSPVVHTGGADGVEPLPSMSVIRDDWPRLPGATCRSEDELGWQPTGTEVCVLGSDDRPRRVVVVGDSHVAHWLPPLAAMAETHSWQVVGMVRGGCNLSTESEFIQEGWPEYEECATWRAHLVERIVSLEPDLVVSLGTRTGFGPGEESVPPGFLAAWAQLSDAGLRVIALRDSPRHVHDVPDCTARWGDTSAACEVPRSSVYTEPLLAEVEPSLPPRVSILDTSPYFCTDTTCPALIGNVRVYMDNAHVTATYMSTVRAVVEDDLLALADCALAPC